MILYELRIDSIDLIDLIKNGKLQNIGEKEAKFGYFWEPWKLCLNFEMCEMNFELFQPRSASMCFLSILILT